MYLSRPSTLRYPHQSCHMNRVADIDNHAKFHQVGSGFSTLRGRNLPFSMLSAVAYVTATKATAQPVMMNSR